MRHLRVATNGIHLHAAVAGEGKPVVLLHGFPEHWWSWRRQLPVLADAGLSAWALDLRGYNESDRPIGRTAYRRPQATGFTLTNTRGSPTPSSASCGKPGD